ncbi:unnamed protein product, partial [Discosporangium mesarthrocarpum]
TPPQSLQDFTDSIATLFETVLGEFDLEGIQKINAYTAPFLFLGFIFIMAFVLLSMMFAIVNMAFGDVRKVGGQGYKAEV